METVEYWHQKLSVKFLCFHFYPFCQVTWKFLKPAMIDVVFHTECLLQWGLCFSQYMTQGSPLSNKQLGRNPNSTWYLWWIFSKCMMDTFREWLSLYSDTCGTYSSVCVHRYVSTKTEIFLKPSDQILKSRIHFYCLHGPFLKYSGLPFLWFWFPRFQLPLVSRNLTISTSFTSLLSSHRHCIISRHRKKKGTVW